MNTLWVHSELSLEQHFIPPEVWKLLGLGCSPDGTPDYSSRVRSNADIHVHYPRGVKQWNVKQVPGSPIPVYIPISVNGEVLEQSGKLILCKEHGFETGQANTVYNDAKAFMNYCSAPLTRQERAQGRVTRGIYETPIMKLSFATDISQCPNSELHGDKLSNNPSVIVEVTIGAQCEILARRGGYENEDDEEKQRKRSAMEEILKIKGNLDDAQKKLKDELTIKHMIEDRYYCRKPNAISIGFGNEADVPFEWWSHNVAGPKFDMNGVTLNTLQHMLEKWAYFARKDPMSWGIVDVTTVSTDEIRFGFGNRVNMLALPKYCLSPQRHKLFCRKLTDDNKEKIPPFCLERNNCQICINCKYKHGQDANAKQKGPAEYVLTCESFCCLYAICGQCADEDRLLDKKRRASLKGLMKHDVLDNTTQSHLYPPDLLFASFELDLDEDLIRKTPGFIPRPFRHHSEALLARAEMWAKVEKVLKNAIVTEMNLEQPVDTRCFIVLKPWNVNDPTRFAVLHPYVGQHVFGRKEGPDPTEETDDVLVDGEAKYHPFDPKYIAENFQNLVLKSNNLPWLNKAKIRRGRAKFWGDLQPPPVGLKIAKTLSDSMTDLSSAISDSSSDSNEGTWSTYSIDQFDPISVAGRLCVCREKCEKCGQWYGLHDGGKEYHFKFVCAHRSNPGRVPRNSVKAPLPHSKDRRRSSMGAPEGVNEALDAERNRQRAVVKSKLVYGWYETGGLSHHNLE